MSNEWNALNVKSFGALGNGVASDTAAFAAALQASQIEQISDIVIPAGKYVIDGLVAVPKEVTLKFDKYARLILTTSGKLDVHGSIEAGLHQVFYGGGAITGRLQNAVVYPQWFGASGSDQVTKGSISAGSTILTVQDTLDFEPGQEVFVEGTWEQRTLTLTNGATSTGEITIRVGISNLNDLYVKIPVQAGDTAVQVADKVRAVSAQFHFEDKYKDGKYGWHVIKGAGDHTVIFRSEIGGVRFRDIRLTSDGGTGVTTAGDAVKTVPGVKTLSATIIAVDRAQKTLTLGAAAEATYTAVNVAHDDSLAFRRAFALSRTVTLPGDLTYMLGSTVSIPAGGALIGAEGFNGGAPGISSAPNFAYTNATPPSGLPTLGCIAPDASPIVLAGAGGKVKNVALIWKFQHIATGGYPTADDLDQYRRYPAAICSTGDSSNLIVENIVDCNSWTAIELRGGVGHLVSRIYSQSHFTAIRLASSTEFIVSDVYAMLGTVYWGSNRHSAWNISKGAIIDIDAGGPGIVRSVTCSGPYYGIKWKSSWGGRIHDLWLDQTNTPIYLGNSDYSDINSSSRPFSFGISNVELGPGNVNSIVVDAPDSLLSSGANPALVQIDNSILHKRPVFTGTYNVMIGNSALYNGAAFIPKHDKPEYALIRASITGSRIRGGWEVGGTYGVVELITSAIGKLQKGVGWGHKVAPNVKFIWRDLDNVSSGQNLVMNGDFSQYHTTNYLFGTKFTDQNGIQAVTGGSFSFGPEGAISLEDGSALLAGSTIWTPAVSNNGGLPLPLTYFTTVKTPAVVPSSSKLFEFGFYASESSKYLVRFDTTDNKVKLITAGASGVGEVVQTFKSFTPAASSAYQVELSAAVVPTNSNLRKISLKIDGVEYFSPILAITGSFKLRLLIGGSKDTAFTDTYVTGPYPDYWKPVDRYQPVAYALDFDQVGTRGNKPVLYTEFYKNELPAYNGGLMPSSFENYTDKPGSYSIAYRGVQESGNRNDQAGRNGIYFIFGSFNNLDTSAPDSTRGENTTETWTHFNGHLASITWVTYFIHIRGDANIKGVFKGSVSHVSYALGTAQAQNAENYSDRGLNTTKMLRMDSLPAIAINNTGHHIDTNGNAKLQSLYLTAFTSLPPADTAQRGRVIVLSGTSGAADALYVCLKNASGAYEWVRV